MGLLLVEKGLENPKLVAKKLNVSERTLRSWKKLARDGDYKKVGRPKKIKLAEKLRMIKLIKEEYVKQGRPGWRPICASLKGKVPIRIIQFTLKKIKLKERVNARAERIQKQLRVEVLKENVIWTQDGTHLGRLRSKKEVQAQVIKDRFTLATIDIEVGPSSNSENIKAMLEKHSEDQLPLVWMTDNGTCYVNKEIEHFTNERKVIHLKNFPHTPEHNGACERHIRELKKLTGLGKGMQLKSVNEAGEMIQMAAWTLNNNRRHGSKGYRTSVELKSTDKNPLGELRNELYNRYKKELHELNSSKQGLSLRRAEREMVLRLLSEYKLVKITTRDGLVD